MNAVIYARFSSHNQTEQSIEGQLKTCYEFAQKNGYTIVGEYIDRAISGTTDARPDFLRMIEDSAKKGFQYVLVTASPVTAMTVQHTRQSSKRMACGCCQPVKISQTMQAAFL